jgi:hypothetical protein
MGDGESRVLRPSRAKGLRQLAKAVGLTVAVVLLAAHDGWVGWLMATLVGLIALGLALMLLPNSVYLKIDPDGFTVCSYFRAHSYRWSDVDTFGVAPIFMGFRAERVMFNYSPQYHGAKRRNWWAETSGFQAAFPDNYGMRAAELAELLNQYKGRYSGT